MRSDYALYVLAIVFFAITLTSIIMISTEFERNLSAVATTVLGLLSIGVGYTLRPRTRTLTVETTKPQPLAKTSGSAIPMEPLEKKTTAEGMKTSSLTDVKGIKEKRAQQLRTIGITSVRELADASAEDLATKLKIAKYFPEQWIQNAKKMLEKS